MSERRNPYLDRSIGYFRRPPFPGGRHSPTQAFAPVFEERNHPWVHLTCILITVALLALAAWKWDVLTNTVADLMLEAMEDGIHVFLIFGNLVFALDTLRRKYTEPKW